MVLSVDEKFIHTVKNVIYYYYYYYYYYLAI